MSVAAGVESFMTTNVGAERDVEGSGGPGSNLLEEAIDLPTDDGADNERISNLSAKVFGNDMLREIILKNVIWGNTTNPVSRKDVKNLRLVRKGWIRTVSEILRKIREPLFQILLKKENSVLGSLTPEFQEGGKLLDQFVSSLNNDGLKFDSSIPPFRLKIMPDFLRQENYESFADCLISCGKGLLDLDVSFPTNSSMTFVFHLFSLPKLQKLSVQFSDQKLLDVDDESVSTVSHNGHTVYPLQAILNGTETVQELQFQYSTTTDILIPVGFEYLKLPVTITKLLVDCAVKSSDLMILLKNDLPNLYHLRLFATNQAFGDGLIYEILNKFKSHLKTLNLRGNQYHGRVRNTTLFKLPVMEKLETLTVTSQCWELEGDSESIAQPGWHSQLPELHEMRILHTTDTMLEKWTAQSKFDSVERLFVSLINVNVTSVFHPHPQHAEHPMPLTLERMQKIHLAFPNIVCLEVSVCGPQTCGLKYLFMEMRNLRKLAITLRGSGDYIHPIYWDTLLIGCPPDITASLRRNTDFWNNFELKDDNNFPSIRKLTQLKSLALVESFVPARPADATRTFSGGSLISDLTFHFALLKMSNLKHLLISGRFMVTFDMNERWKKEKGTCIHSIRKTW